MAWAEVSGICPCSHRILWARVVIGPLPPLLGAVYTAIDMNRTDLHRLVDELPDEAIDGAVALIQRVVLGEIDPDQAWVWSPEWQAQLRTSMDDIVSGRTQVYQGADPFIDSLK